MTVHKQNHSPHRRSLLSTPSTVISLVSNCLWRACELHSKITYRLSSIIWSDRNLYRSLTQQQLASWGRPNVIHKPLPVSTDCKISQGDHDLQTNNPSQLTIWLRWMIITGYINALIQVIQIADRDRVTQGGRGSRSQGVICFIFSTV